MEQIWICACCGKRAFIVDSRRRDDGVVIRRRECPRGTRFTTYELVGDQWHRLRKDGAAFAAVRKAVAIAA
jgi:transcriptional regulator NrdR family protein